MSKERYACKMIDIINDDFDLSEMKILKKVQHQHVVTLINVYKSPTVIYVLQELCTCSLEDLISNIGKMTILQCKHVGSQLLYGLSYIHDQNIIHRDIKPANILVAEEYLVKICDFGLSYDLENPSPYSAINEECGTSGYIPPEIDMGYNWSKTSDVWAFGVVMLDMLFGMKRNKYKFNVPSEAAVIKKIFVNNPTLRPSAKECLKFDFFQI